MPATTPGIDWNNQTISTLRTLWSEGHSTAEIGRRMGVSKNAIVGKAHRLVLPPRPSPIRGGAEGRAKPSPRVRPPVPPLATLLPANPPVRSVPATAPAAPASPRVPDPLPARPTVRRSPVPGCGCQWPIGAPGTQEFRLCGDEPVARKPYCESHCGRAYVRPRDTAAGAAAAA